MNLTKCGPEICHSKDRPENESRAPKTATNVVTDFLREPQTFPDERRPPQPEVEAPQRLSEAPYFARCQSQPTFEQRASFPGPVTVTNHLS